MNVLITGAGGFIGTHLVRDQLARGRYVTAIDLSLSSLEPLRSEKSLDLIETDYRDEALDARLMQHDVCFHLAGLHLEVGPSEQDYLEVNVRGVQDFVERCHQAGVSRFVHCSSVGVYGDIQALPADEETENNPTIDYERSKLLGERAVLEFGRDRGYPVVVLRPSWVYGPGCPRLDKLIRSIKSGRFFYVGDGSNLRHPIHIKDMVAGFELAATHQNAPGEIFVMAGPRAVSVRELVEEIADRLGVARPWLRLPRALVWISAFGYEQAFSLLGQSPKFSRRSLKFFTGNSDFRIDKANRLLGFNPQYALVDGLSSALPEILERMASRDH